MIPLPPWATLNSINVMIVPIRTCLIDNFILRLPSIDTTTPDLRRVHALDHLC